MLFQDKVAHDPTAPGGSRSSFAIMRMPDGSFSFYNRYAPDKGPVRLPDAFGEEHVLLPHLPQDVLNSEAILKNDVLGAAQVIMTAENEVARVFIKRETLTGVEAKKIGLPRYLNVWFQKSDLNATQDPEMIWRGYNGSQMEYEQISTGRFLVPYGSFQPHEKSLPPHGRHKTIIQYSDDTGANWKESVSQLVSPCYSHFNGSNEGACEPAFEELGNGELWMLMRTQAGFLYESSSTDSNQKCLHLRKPNNLPADGATWNFPNGWKETLTTRVLFRKEAQGGSISLNDRFFDPVNDWGGRPCHFSRRAFTQRKNRKRSAQGEPMGGGEFRLGS